MRELDGKLWYIDANGYWVHSNSDKTDTKQHRYIWEKANGPIPDGMQIDHINGKRDDNRLSNLRVVSHRENALNSKLRITNKSGVTGVSWHKQRDMWRSDIKNEGKQITLGHFDDWFEAVCCRMSANNLYGYHPNHGRR
jgi:hypothetical protein